MKYGVVFWNFYLKYFYDQFVVEGYGILKDFFLYNFYIIRFYYDIYSNGFIFSVEVISFEFKDFFVFIKFLVLQILVLFQGKNIGIIKIVYIVNF